MAMYPPSRPTRNARGGLASGTMSQVGPRARTPKPQKDVSPSRINSLEDLTDRLLEELRIQRGPYANMARERVLRLLRGYIGALMERERKQLHAPSSPRSPRTAIPFDNMSEETAELNVSLAEASARVATTRAQLAAAQLARQQTEEKMLIAEERWRRAEDRAERAEARIQKMEDEQWTLRMAPFVKGDVPPLDLSEFGGRSGSPLQRTIKKARSPSPRPGGGRNFERDHRHKLEQERQKIIEKAKKEARTAADKERLQAVSEVEQAAEEAKRRAYGELEKERARIREMAERERQEVLDQLQREAEQRVDEANANLERAKGAGKVREEAVQEQRKAQEALSDLKKEAMQARNDLALARMELVSATKKSEEAEREQAMNALERERIRRQNEEQSSIRKLDHRADLDKLHQQYDAIRDDKSWNTERAGEKIGAMYQQMICKVLLGTVFDCWKEFAVRVKVGRDKLKLEEELQDVKERHRADLVRGGVTAEKLAEKFHLDNLRKLQGDCFSVWKEVYLKDIVGRKEERYERELDRLKRMVRVPGGKTAEALAEKMMEKRNFKTIATSFNEWLRVMVQEINEKRHAESKSKHAEEMENLKKMSGAQRALHADRIAKEMEKRNNLDRLGVAFSGLRDLRHAATLEHKDRKYQEQIHRMDREHRLRAKGKLEQVADSHYRKRLLELQSILFSEWCKDLQKGVKTRQIQKHEKELDEMKQMHRKKGDQTAEQMAKKFQLIQKEKLLQTCFVAWNKDHLRTLGEREAAKEKQKFQQELDDFKSKTRKKGDKSAEQIAEKLYNRQMLALQDQVLRIWMADVRAGLAEKQKEKVKKEFDQKMDEFKSSEREKGGKRAEKAAVTYYHNKLLKLAQKCMNSWQQDCIYAATDRHKVVLEQEFDKKLEVMKEQERAKGDHIAEDMATQYRKKMEWLLVNECFEHWCKTTLDEKAAKKQKEFDDFKVKTRKKGDATAEAMADKFRKERQERLLLLIIKPWQMMAAVNRYEREKDKVKNELTHQLDDFKKQTRKLGDSKAELMAETFRKKKLYEKCRVVLTKWDKEKNAVRAAKKREEAKEKYDKEMEDFKTKTRQHGDASAESMANSFQKRLYEKVQMRCILAWRKDATNEKAERKRREQEMLYEEEIKTLQNEAREKGDATAEQIAAKFHKQQMLGLLGFLVNEWQDFARHTRVERERANERNDFDKQIDRLKSEERQKGDQKAELIATQYQKKMKAKLLLRTLASWMKVATQGRGERKMEEQKKEQQTKLKELKALHDQSLERGGEVAEQMATQYRRKIEQQMMREVLRPWSSFAHASVAAREAEEVENAHAKELNDLKKKSREKGDATAQQMAKQFNQKRMRAIHKEIVTSWHAYCLERRQERLLEEAQSKLDKELEDMKREERQKGDEKANLMAEKFREKRNKVLCQRSVTGWYKWARELIVTRQKSEQTAEHQEKIRKFQERVEDERDRLATKFYKFLLRAQVMRCIVMWAMVVQVHQTKDRLETQFQIDFNQLEEDVMVLVDQKDKKMLDLAKNNADKVKDFDRLMVVMRHFASWIAGKALFDSEGRIAKMQRQQEDELAQMVALQQQSRFKIVSHMGERYILMIQRSIRERVWVEWNLTLKIYKAVKTQVVDRMHNINDLKDTIENFEEKQMMVLNRLEMLGETTRNRKMNHRVLTQWHQVVRASKLFFQEMARQAEYEKKVMELRISVTERAGEILGKMQADLDDAELKQLCLRCFSAWKMEIHGENLLKACRSEAKEIKVLYDKELRLFQTDAEIYRLKAAQRTADAAYDASQQNLVGLCFHSWLKYTEDQAVLKAHTRMAEELDKLRMKHSALMCELRDKEEKMQGRMLTFINHVQDHKNGEEALIKCFNDWASCRLIVRSEHRRILQKEIMLKRDHGASTAFWAFRKMNIFSNELLMYLLWSWWLMDVFESQMVKEIRGLREKHLEDVAFAEDGERLRSHYRLSKIADWIQQCDRSFVLHWAISGWFVLVKTTVTERKSIALKQKLQKEADDKLAYMKARENVHAYRITAVLARISRDKYRLQTMLHWRGITMVSVSTKNYAKDVSRLETRNVKLAKDMSDLRREHGFKVASLVSDKWGEYVNELMLCFTATLWWMSTQYEKRFNNVRKQAKNAAEKHTEELGEMTRSLHHQYAREEMLRNATDQFGYTIKVLRDLLNAPRVFSSWKGAWMHGYTKRKIKAAQDDRAGYADSEVAEARRQFMVMRVNSVDRCAYMLIREKRLHEWLRYVGAWQRYISRKKLEAEIAALQNKLRSGKDDLKRDLDAENVTKRMRLHKQKEVLQRMLMDTIRNEIQVRVFILWNRCIVLSKINQERTQAIKDAEQRAAMEGRARRVAEAEARRAAELQPYENQASPRKASPGPQGRGVFQKDHWQPGGGRVPNPERCGRMGSALWRVARRRLATGLVALMSNDGALNVRGGGTPGAWSWRPERAGSRSPVRQTPQGIRPALAAQPPFPALKGSETPRGQSPEPSYRLPTYSTPPLGPSSAAAVSNTLDRLARARELIAAGGREADEDQRPQSPLRSLSPRNERAVTFDPNMRSNRTTVAEHAALQAQISELQKYMDRVHERF